MNIQKLLVLVLIILCFTGGALGQEPFLGISAYSAMDRTYPTEKLFKCFPDSIEKPAIAVLFKAFGKETRTIDAFCKKFKDRDHLVEIHLSAETARRTNRDGGQIQVNLSPSEYSKALAAGNHDTKDSVRKRVHEVIRILSDSFNKNTHVVFSGGLEGDYSETAATVLHNIIKNNTFTLTVYSPDGPRGFKAGAYFLEDHGSYGGFAEFWNNDGSTLDFKDDDAYPVSITPEEIYNTYKTNKRKLHAVLLWSANQQGLGRPGHSSGQPYAGREYVFTYKACAGMRTLLLNLQSVK